MEASEHITELTASEIAQLWISYQNDSMAICGIHYFLQHVENDDIRSILEYAMEISGKHVEQVTHFFNNENYPVPQGFTEHDVNLDAPRLFSDKLYLHYILNMGKFGLTAYALALSLSERTDMIEYYTECLAQTTELHNRAKGLAKEKGVFYRAPLIPKPEQIDFVKKQTFLAGWLGDRRPLLGVEIANLVYNVKRNALGQAIITGFSQVAKSKDVRQYFERGRDIAGKHLEIFTSLLHEDYLSEGQLLLTSEVTHSKVAPFSDKLMMYHITALIGSGIGQYGMAMASSPRHDLGVHYVRLVGELVHYADDGANIMINNCWLEDPPKAADRKDLAK